MVTSDEHAMSMQKLRGYCDFFFSHYKALGTLVSKMKSLA